MRLTTVCLLLATLFFVPAGANTQNPPCCSQAVDSQLAATAAGNPDPLTKPKNRGPAIAVVDPQAYGRRTLSISYTAGCPSF